MYTKTKTTLDFHQQHPFFTTCGPNTLKLNHGTMSDVTLHSYRSKSVIIPINPSPDEENSNSSSAHSSPQEPTPSSSYWSWTFALVTFPFVFCGCPFYLLTVKLPLKHPVIRTTGSWLKHMFNCSTFPCLPVLTFILLILAVITNIHFFYTLGTLFNSLFIAGVYKESMLKDLYEFIIVLPVIIPLDYVWLRGFKINNIVTILDHKRRHYNDVSCSYNIRLVVLMLIVFGIQTIRFISYKKYKGNDFLEIVDTTVSFTTDVFVSLMLPLYCAFCYAVKFEFMVIKSVIYKLISKQMRPTVSHLNQFKTLYTHAADHIVAINSLFSLYMSLVILFIIVGTLIDATTLFETIIASITQLIFGNTNLITDVVGPMLNNTNCHHSGLPNTGPSLPHLPLLDSLNLTECNSANDLNNMGTTSGEVISVRQVNADIVCILITYALICFTVWQAVGTNDCAREIHVWLNDFCAGGGGTDVKEVLMDLGIATEKENLVKRKPFSSSLDSYENVETSQLPLVWARNTELEDGHDDEFIQKFRMLKSYIHVRMQLELPALLNISLVGVLVPALSGRLKRYQVLY
ncbi:unnamed protein product [Orchesella dallaii]|uniref:Gustatory receptor n=1 Tax=Orchesella dallaii TaxID=48710 RepID=A0ABP1QL50_9HEXA